jgi:predicted transcriptional regulator
MPARGNPNAQREAFRAFMTAHRLRATEWAKEAGIPASQIYSFLTGKSQTLARATAEKLARAANVRVDDMFRTKK